MNYTVSNSPGQNDMWRQVVWPDALIKFTVIQNSVYCPNYLVEVFRTKVPQKPFSSQPLGYAFKNFSHWVDILLASFRVWLKSITNIKGTSTIFIICFFKSCTYSSSIPKIAFYHFPASITLTIK